MKLLKLTGTALLAALSLGMLVYFLMGDQVAERRIPLILLSAISLVWFTRKNALTTVVMIIPVGPILDTAFMTSGRGIYATEAVLLAAVTIWLDNKIRKGSTWLKPTLPVLLLCIYASVGALTLLAGDNSLFSNLRMLRQLFLAAMTALMIQDLLSLSDMREQLQQRWTMATLAGLALLSLGGILEFFSTHSEPGSFYRGSVSLAVHIAFFSPIALSLWLGSQSRIWRMAAAATWILSIICLPLTASRGAMGSVLITSVALLVIATLRGRRLGWPTMVLILLVGLAGGMVLTNPQLAGEDFAYKINASLKGDFFSTRINEWKHAISVLKTSPLTGEGPDASSSSIPLEVAQRNGIPAALCLFAAVFAAIIMPIRRIWSLEFSAAAVNWGLILGLIGFLLVGLAETGLGARTTPLLVLAIVLSSSWVGIISTKNQE